MKIERRGFLKQSALALGTLALGPVVWRNNSYADEAVSNTNGSAQTQGTKLGAAQATKPAVYFFENFRSYNTKAPTVVDDSGISLYNETIFARMAAINISLSQSGLVLREYSPANPPANLQDYDVLFQFRLREKDGKLGHFQLRLRNSQKGKAGDVIVGISSDEVKISSDGLNPAVNGGAKLPFTIEKNQWHQAALTVRNGELTVLIDNDRELKAVAQAKVSGLSSAGINFYGFQDSPFSLTDIILRAPAPLPNNDIANILPAPFQVNEADFKRGITQAVPANDIFGATIRTGLEANAVKMTINDNDGTSRDVTFTVLPITEKQKSKKDGKTMTEKIERPDAFIRITGLDGSKSSLDYYIRPLLRRYFSPSSFTDTYYDIIRDWDLLPKASEHPLKVELRRTASGADILLDGSYAASIESADIKAISFALSPTASVGNIFSEKRAFDAQKYFPVDIAAQQMAKSFVQTKTSINPGFSDVKDIPMFVTSGAGSADVGLIREGQGDWALEVDEYLSRSPFDGLLTEIHCTVPGGAPYTKAWVLAAVDLDPAKDAILTARITHYEPGGIGGNLIADTTIKLPRGDEKPAAGVTSVGTVSGIDHSGQKINLPLYLIEVPLNSGKILDLYANSSLNFEFLGKLDRNMQQRDFTMKPDPKSTSAVQIFGATLEKSSIGMDIVETQPGNVFVEGETPTTGLMLKSFGAAQGKISWEMFDADDNKAGSGTTDYSFTKVGEEKQVTIPLQMKELGWYRLLISAQDQKGNDLFTHSASFALLGKDLRQAKYDSPYSIWWWDGSHRTTKNVDFDAPLMFKAGIRRATWTKRSEAELSKWFITKPQHNRLFNFPDLANPQKALEKNEAILRAEVAKYPHTREALIFHESGPRGDVPAELLDGQPELTPKGLAHEQRYADLLNLAGAFYREKFPQLKLVVGNTGTSQSTIAAALRHGGNPDFIDYIGIEATGQSFIPEKVSEVPIPGSHMATDVAKKLTGRTIPATGCIEGTSRAQRDLGADQHAQWYMRDVLIGLANGYTTICNGSTSDTSSAYYNTYWGAGGITERTPYGYPKKAYVAYATLTNVLDQVTLRRQVPTGSTTVYAIEFDRADKKLATALWASRGDADYNLTFSSDTTVTVVEMYGQRRELKTVGGKLTVRAGVRPTYLVAEKEITAITLSNRTFPEDEARAKLATVAAPFTSTKDVALDKDNSLDSPKMHPLILPVRQLGNFDIRQVKDEQKGDVLELELNTSKNPGLSKYITEYATLRLSTPATISGEPAALGIWIKGNSNWGRALFEIEDAQGEVWRSTGTSGWGCDIVDWPGHLSVNFDGWNLLALPLRDSMLFHDNSPGPLLEQWVSSGGNKHIEYPIKLRALVIEMNRTPLDLLDFKAANPVIRLKDAGGIYEK